VAQPKISVNTIQGLSELIASRKANAPAGSYTGSLFAKGEDEIVKKVGEEAIEVIVAAKGQGQERLISESADLIYHLLVLLAEKDVPWADVEAELERRRK
jgi:phosphoribosyl-ATP pyrophosphohydrolase